MVDSITRECLAAFSAVNCEILIELSCARERTRKI